MAKVAIITGSTSGIGLGIAKALAELKMNIVINGFAPPEEIEAIKKELQALGAPEALYVGSDLSTSKGAKELVEQSYKHFKAVDILINNAGVQHVAAIEDFPEEKWDLIIAVNLSAAFYTSKTAVPYMKKRKWGRIINVASTHGLVASARKPAYIAAKHGLVGLSKSMAIELANTGITVNTICPGWVLTALVKKQIEAMAAENKISYEQAKVKLLSEKQPLTEFNTPENIAAMVKFLVSDEAAVTTGSNMVLDGGWTAQ